MRSHLQILSVFTYLPRLLAEKTSGPLLVRRHSLFCAAPLASGPECGWGVTFEVDRCYALESRSNAEKLGCAAQSGPVRRENSNAES